MVRDLTENTGKRMAVALEGMAGATKFPELPSLTPALMGTIIRFIDNAGSLENLGAYGLVVSPAVAVAERPTITPLYYFLRALQNLKNHGLASTDSVAFVSGSFLKLLRLEISRNHSGKLTQSGNGWVKVCGCTCYALPPAYFPAGFPFILLGKPLLDGLKALEKDGLLTDSTALTACLNEYGMNGFTLHNYPGLGTLDCSVSKISGGKIILTVNQPKENIAYWYYIMKSNYASLPGLTSGTAIAPTTSTDPWYGAVALQTQAQNYKGDGKWELTPGSGTKWIKVVQTDSSLRPYLYRTLCFDPS